MTLTGALLTAVILMLRVFALLSPLPSLTTNVTVRASVLGLSLVLLYLTLVAPSDSWRGSWRRSE